jgi:hypothetical protein
VKRENIVTYTANGLVAESFHYLAATGDSIAMGSRYDGVSMVPFDDLDAPKGKVYNCRQSALHGLAADQGRFYAWVYDSSIVDLATCTVIYDDAPMGTRTGFGAYLKTGCSSRTENFLSAPAISMPMAMCPRIWKTI